MLVPHSEITEGGQPMEGNSFFRLEISVSALDCCEEGAASSVNCDCMFHVGLSFDSCLQWRQ